MPQECLKNTGPMSNDTPTSGTLFDLNQLTSSAEGSPAKTFPSPAREQGLKESDQPYGAKCSGLFAKLGPDGSWLKTSQGYSQVMVDGSLEGFLETWPPAGTMRSGECYLRPLWERPTEDNEFSLWPTPVAQESPGSAMMKLTDAVDLSLGRKPKYYKGGMPKKMWPTPTASDGNHQPKSGGQLNPTWVEWLMGFPLGWTDLSV